MKSRAIPVFLVLAYLTGCAATGHEQVTYINIPADVTVVAPDETIPKDLAAFSGKWTGGWYGARTHTHMADVVIVVERVLPAAGAAGEHRKRVENRMTAKAFESEDASGGRHRLVVYLHRHGSTSPRPPQLLDRVRKANPFTTAVAAPRSPTSGGSAGTSSSTASAIPPRWAHPRSRVAQYVQPSNRKCGIRIEGKQNFACQANRPPSAGPAFEPSYGTAPGLDKAEWVVPLFLVSANGDPAAGSPTGRSRQHAEARVRVLPPR
jgi:hypothetical protein